MILSSSPLEITGVSSLEELQKRVLRDQKKLQDQTWSVGGRLSMVLVALSLTGWGAVFFTDFQLSWLRSVVVAFSGVTIIYLLFRRVQDRLIIKKMVMLKARYNSRIAIMPIRLWTLPRTTFVALLTVDGGFDILPTPTEGLEATLREKLSDVCIVALPLCLEAASAGQVPVEEFEFVLNSLAGGVGEKFIAPLDAELVQIKRLAHYEDRAIRSN